MQPTGQTAAEAALREHLAQANQVLGSVAPIIAYKLESPGQPLVNDSIVARLRGMLENLALQVLVAANGTSNRTRPDQQDIDLLASIFAGNERILGHLYALAMEGHLAERLEQRAALNPVHSPLLQKLVASDKPRLAELATDVLSSQARFMQQQRRMELSITELPPEVFFVLLEERENGAGCSNIDLSTSSIGALRDSYDEAETRLGLFARLISMMSGGAVAGLELENAGLSLFASSIAALTDQPRDITILACHERQAVRLALGLRAAGQEEEAIERQLVLLEPSEWFPPGLATLPPERAASLLDDTLAHSQAHA